MRRPSERALSDFLAEAGSGDAFTYPEVGATRNAVKGLPESLAGRYDLDHHRFDLGRGRKRYQHVRSALRGWGHFRIPWLQLRGGEAPVHTGQVVASLASIGGLWFGNPCRVVYADFGSDSSNLAAFAYGTLPGHVECGEERFQVSFDPESEKVTYALSAFSRPAVLLTRLGYPFARRVQRRFAAASALALAREADRADSLGSLD